MKFFVDQNRLRSALAIVSRAVSTKNEAEPVYKTVFIKAIKREAPLKSALKLRAFNGDTDITTWLEATVEEEGESLVYGHLLLPFVSTIPSDQELTFEHLTDKDGKATRLKVSATHYESDFNELDTANFTGTDNQVLADSVFVEAGALKHAIRQVSFAASRDVQKPTINSVLLRAHENTLTLAALDGFRLSEKTVQLIDTLDPTRVIQAIIPVAGIDELANSLPDDATEVELGLNSQSSAILFKFGYTLLQSGIISGSYPTYDSFMGLEPVASVIFNARTLKTHLGTAAVYSKDGQNAVRFLVNKDGSVNLLAIAQEMGRFSCDIKAKGTKLNDVDVLKVAANVKLLSQTINSIESEYLVLEVTKSPIYIKPVDEEGNVLEGHRTMVLPMHFKEDRPADTTPEQKAA